MTKTQTCIVAALGIVAAYFIFLEGKSFMKFIQPLDKFSPAPQNAPVPGTNVMEYT